TSTPKLTTNRYLRMLTTISIERSLGNDFLRYQIVAQNERVHPCWRSTKTNHLAVLLININLKACFTATLRLWAGKTARRAADHSRQTPTVRAARLCLKCAQTIGESHVNNIRRLVPIRDQEAGTIAQILARQSGPCGGGSACLAGHNAKHDRLVSGRFG